MKSKNLTYQKAFDQLKEISDDIQEGKIPIEQLPDAIQKAKQLVKFCQELLRKVENELSMEEE